MKRLFKGLHLKGRFPGKDKREIDPDEIFIDSSNLPQFDVHSFEGRLEKPITTKTIVLLGLVFALCGVAFFSRLWVLQVERGEAFSERSENNRLRFTDIFANRGVIFDRNGEILASNKENPSGEFALRTYSQAQGLSHVVGYLKYPTKDAHGFYFRKSFIGEDGVEAGYDETLAGTNGLKIVETDALGNIKSESENRLPVDGLNVSLSIDSKVQSELWRIIKDTAEAKGFTGGAGIIMDVRSGELLSLVSFPEYDSTLLTDGKNENLQKYLNDPAKPFLNRAVSGLYTPGSIIKPILALGALKEVIISPRKEILSTGELVVPNPYFPDRPTIFLDWKEHGYTDMRRAIAVSSNVYFFHIGGGFGNQRGLGIEKIEKYVRAFGWGEKTGIGISSEQEGVIPSPSWKERVFEGDPWRIGDTYNSSIGQYGFQITPLQVARYIAAIANGGTLLTPTVIKDDASFHGVRKLGFSEEHINIIKEGLRLAVTEGTASGLNVPYVDVAAKTGTAEVGITKQSVNSWSIGFFPYDNPRYAFTILMERGPRSNQIGATSVMRQLFDWLNIYAQEYLLPA